jgi:hypothetical protein
MPGQFYRFRCLFAIRFARALLRRIAAEGREERGYAVAPELGVDFGFFEEACDFLRLAQPDAM